MGFILNTHQALHIAPQHVFTNSIQQGPHVPHPVYFHASPVPNSEEFQPLLYPFSPSESDNKTQSFRGKKMSNHGILTFRRDQEVNQILCVYLYLAQDDVKQFTVEMQTEKYLKIEGAFIQTACLTIRVLKCNC